MGDIAINNVNDLKDLFVRGCKKSSQKFTDKLSDVSSNERKRLREILQLEEDDWGVNIEAMLSLAGGNSKTPPKKKAAQKPSPEKNKEKDSVPEKLKPERFIHNDTYRNITPPMGEEKYKEFREDILKNGILNPVHVSTDGTLLDGYHRHKVYMELKDGGHKIDLPYTVWSFQRNEEIISFIKSQNEHRRHIQVWHSARQALEVLPQIKEEVKIKAAEARKATKEGKKEVGKEIQGSSFEQAGKMYGISPASVQQAQTIMKDAPPKIKKNLDKGEVSLFKAFKDTIKYKNDKKILENLPPEEKKEINFKDPVDVANAAKDFKQKKKEEKEEAKLKATGRKHPKGPREEECEQVLAIVMSVKKKEIDIDQAIKEIEERIELYKKDGE